MALPIDVLTTEQTKEQIQASILAFCAGLGLRVTAWQSGGVALVIIGAVAQLFAAFTVNIATATRAGFLDLSTGSFLTLVAYYVYGVERDEATYATGDVALTNASGAEYTYEAGEFVMGRPAPNEVTYVNAVPFTLGVVGTPEAEQTVSFRCQVAGDAGTASAGAIRRVVSTAQGVTATNPQALLGSNGESDEHLRSRCRKKLGTLSPNGPRDAYAYQAESAKDSAGASLGVTRVGFLRTTGDGFVRMFLASDSGSVGSDVVDAVDLIVQRTTTPDAVTCVVASATNASVPVTATIYIDTAANMATKDVRAAAVVRLDTFFKRVPVGGKRLPSTTQGAVLWRAIEAELAQIHELVIEVKVSPESDRVLAANEVAVPGAYKISVEQVPS